MHFSSVLLYNSCISHVSRLTWLFTALQMDKWALPWNCYTERDTSHCWYAARNIRTSLFLTYVCSWNNNIRWYCMNWAVLSRTPEWILDIMAYQAPILSCWHAMIMFYDSCSFYCRFFSPNSRATSAWYFMQLANTNCLCGSWKRRWNWIWNISGPNLWKWPSAIIWSPARRVAWATFVRPSTARKRHTPSTNIRYEMKRKDTDPWIEAMFEIDVKNQRQNDVEFHFSWNCFWILMSFWQLGEDHDKTKESSECLRHLTHQAVVLQKKMNEIYTGKPGANLPPIQIQPPSTGSVLDMLNVINGILLVQIR